MPDVVSQTLKCITPQSYSGLYRVLICTAGVAFKTEPVHSHFTYPRRKAAQLG